LSGFSRIFLAIVSEKIQVLPNTENFALSQMNVDHGFLKADLM